MAEQNLIGPDTHSYGVGPISIDVDMARKHGWSEALIEAAANDVARTSRYYAERTLKERPHLFYRAPDGTDIFIGDLSLEARIEIVTGYEKARKAP